MRNRTCIETSKPQFYYDVENQRTICKIVGCINLTKYPFDKVTMDQDDIVTVIKKFLNLNFNAKGNNSVKVAHDDNMYPLMVTFECTGTATCNKIDKYDKKLGENIAMSRAQSNIYKQAAWFYELYLNMMDMRLYSVTRTMNNQWSASMKCDNHAKDLSK